MRYVWNHCDQAEGMVRLAPLRWDYQMDLSFAIHEAALLKPEAVLFYFYLGSATFQFAEFDAETGFKQAKIGKKWYQYETIFELL